MRDAETRAILAVRDAEARLGERHIVRGADGERGINQEQICKTSVRYDMRKWKEAYRTVSRSDSRRFWC